mgnify:CR=1 FL=1
MTADHTTRRLGAHSLERIEPNREGAKAWRVFAGDLGHDLGLYRTKADAKDALDTWHYLHPEEQRARDKAWVHEFIQSMRGALDEGEAERWLDHLAARWGLT